jgi:hypothetical protein
VVAGFCGVISDAPLLATVLPAAADFCSEQAESVVAVFSMLLCYSLVVSHDCVDYLFNSVPAVQLPVGECSPSKTHNLFTRPPDAQARVLVQISAVRCSTC